MSGATYSVYLASQTGTRFATIRDYQRLEYSRVANRVGSLTQTFPAGVVPWGTLARDSRLLVYRSVGGGPEYLDTETVWLVRSRARQLTQQGERLFQIQARSINDILRRAIVAYGDGTTQAGKSLPADDMMKAIVRENMGVLASDAARNLGAYLTVAPDQSLAPVTGRKFAWQRVQDVLSGLADDSAQKGTLLFFDVVAVSENQFEFRTYIGQRGINRRVTTGAGGLALGPEFGNLIDITLTEDSNDEITYAYAGGSGSDDTRVIQVASDTTRLGVSPFNRIETFTSGQALTSSDVQALADSAVGAGVPRIVFRGRVQDTDTTQYGRDWRWGDAMTATVDEYKLDVRADTIKVTVSGGKETVETWLGT